MRSPDDSRPRDLSRPVFAALAVGLPLALWLVHRGRGHEGDLAMFHGWYLAFRESAAFYRDGPGVNYPIVGALLVCGPSALVELAVGHALDLDAFVRVHQLVLVAGEIVATFAAASLARALGSERPRLLALALYVLPITWAGGAWFGQTDVWGTAALLFAAAALARFHAEGDARALALAVLALHAAFLLKQLTWFALPALGALLLAGLARHGSARRWALVLASPALWLVPDPWLTLPDGHVLHVWFVFRRSAGDHGSLLVANGASLWALAPRAWAADTQIVGAMSAFALGWIAWLTAQLACAARLRREGAIGYVRMAGLAQLSMALFMTGVHERYLAHAVPLLFLAARGRLERALGVATGITAGLFVLSSVEGTLSWLGRPEPVIVCSLAWWLRAVSARGCIEAPTPRAQDPSRTDAR